MSTLRTSVFCTVWTPLASCVKGRAVPAKGVPFPAGRISGQRRISRELR